MCVVVFIYEQFSHGITSLLMRLTVLMPLVYGSVLYFIKIKHTQTLFHMSFVTLIVGMFLYGVFEIYGNISPYVTPLFYLAGVWFFIGIIVMFIQREKA